MTTTQKAVVTGSDHRYVIECPRCSATLGNALGFAFEFKFDAEYACRLHNEEHATVDLYTQSWPRLYVKDEVISQVRLDRPSPAYGSDKWVVSAWTPSGENDGYDVQMRDLQKSFDTEEEARQYQSELKRKAGLA